MQQCPIAFFCKIFLRTNNWTYSFDVTWLNSLDCASSMNIPVNMVMGAVGAKADLFWQALKSRLLIKSTNVVDESHQILHASNMSWSISTSEHSRMFPSSREALYCDILSFSFLSVPSSRRLYLIGICYLYAYIWVSTRLLFNIR